jgi:ASC-1-like (ASCH) protein
MHLDAIKVPCSPTDAQVNCLKNNFKIYIQIYIKTAPRYFGVITIIRERIIRTCKSYSC